MYYTFSSVKKKEKTNGKKRIKEYVAQNELKKPKKLGKILHKKKKKELKKKKNIRVNLY